MKSRSTEAPPVTGGRITEAVIAEMAAGGEPLSKAVLVPSIFRVYLHPRDWDRLYPILHELRGDVESELDSALERLNKPLASLPVKYGLRKAKVHRRVKEYWQIDFYPNRDDDAPAGEFLIISDFPDPPRKTELEGGETVRVTRFGTHPGTGQRLDPARRPETVYAQIWFADEYGRRSYLMTRNEVHIGRGGAGRWVDLELRTEIPDVSREHAIIRRNPNSGAFEIKDLSRFGTSVNGTAVPRSKLTENGADVDKDLWTPMPVPSRITLAGKFELEFQPVSASAK